MISNKLLWLIVEGNKTGPMSLMNENSCISLAVEKSSSNIQYCNKAYKRIQSIKKKYPYLFFQFLSNFKFLSNIHIIKISL